MNSTTRNLKKRTLYSILPLIVVMLLFGMAVALRAQTWTTIDFPGGYNTYAFGINNSGDIVGRYGDTPDDSGITHAYLLAGGHFTTIDGPGAFFTAAKSINNQGDIVGRYIDENGSHGFLVQKGTLTTIDHPDAVKGTRLRGINERGDIVGEYTDQDDNFHGFLLDASGFHSIPFPGFNFNDVFDINDRGDIVGYYQEPNGDTHGFKRVHGVFTSFDFPESFGTLGLSMNSQGRIVGFWVEADLETSHGFLLKGTQFQSIDFPTTLVPGANNTDAEGINERGDIVGDYDDANGFTHGYLRVGTQNPDSASNTATTATISGFIRWLPGWSQKPGPIAGATISFTTPDGTEIRPSVATDDRGFYKQTGFPVNTTVKVTPDPMGFLCGTSMPAFRDVFVRFMGGRSNFTVKPFGLSCD